jgi:hypothetical protein
VTAKADTAAIKPDRMTVGGRDAIATINVATANSTSTAPVTASEIRRVGPHLTQRRCIKRIA